MRTKDPTLAETPVRLATITRGESSAHVATVVSLSQDGSPEVRLGDVEAVVPARLALHATRTRLETAILLQQQAVVIFEGGDRSRPIIVGFIEPLDQSAPAVESLPAIEADVDGRRVRLTGKDEIVLECGSASVTLRRNGRVIIRGTYVETRSEGTNRIKGGQVQIN